MSLVYPTKKELLEYKEELLRSGFSYLPPMGDKWVEEMYAMFELIHILPRGTEDFSEAAANLFFKIIKNHRLHDGNKRSAICCLYFFIVLNEKTIKMTNEEIEELAIEVAGSRGNTDKKLIPKLYKLFKEKVL